MDPATPDDSITEGGLVRPMFRLAWPIVIIQLLQVAYNIADTFWLGRLSADAVGAISLAFPLIFLLISIAGGFTTAGAILVAQYTGAKSEGSAGMVAGQILMFVTVLAVLLSALGYVATEPMLSALPSQGQTTVQVIPLAADYMEVFFLGLPFLFGFFVFSALMRGYGDTRTPMRVMLVSVALNVVLDPFLIFGWGPFPHMGIEGAALATIFSRGVASLLGFYVLFVARAGPDVRVGYLVPDLGYIRDIVRIGVPSTIEQSMSALAMITLTAMVVQFAPPVVSAYGLGNRLASLVFLPAMGLGRATNTMVGQNLGAHKADRAERAVWLATKVGASVMVGVAVVAALFPEPIVSVFMATGTDAAARTIEHGAEYLRIRSVEFGFMAVLQVMLGAYRGAGNTKTAMAFSMVALWIGRVPAVLYLAFVADWGPTGIWVGMALGNILGAIAAVAWFTRGTWKETVIDEGADSPAGAGESTAEPDPGASEGK
ncbi:MATE family efflux transporter [Halorussus salilacus]|uniref:MATE family efflux transporter n=1 Tax=Halorussus salilacus TaxID=2953750 RepID=UPI0020A0C960|nr:MATE family efflux transporter [Halorussus salilacus]USZ69541.1 MATE family efflux transporter [Halorussus salilacus]